MINKAKGETMLNKQARYLEIFEDIGFKRVNRIFAPSNLVANAITSRFNKPVKVIETPFFTDGDTTHDTSTLDEVLKFTSERRYFLYYGRLGTWKGTIELANVLHEFLSQNPDVCFVIIGKDKGYNGSSVMQYIREKTKEHFTRIFYSENIPHSQLFPVIQKAWAVVLPSRIENMSNACVESMALGKVVLGANGASFEQLIEDGKNGFLFEKMNEAHLLFKMNQIAQLGEAEKLKIEQNAALIKDRLNPDKIANQLIDFYKEVIAEAKKQ